MYGSSYYRGNSGVPKLRNLTGCGSSGSGSGSSSCGSSIRDGGRGEKLAGGNGASVGTRMSSLSMFEFDSIKEEDEIDELRKSWKGGLNNVCGSAGLCAGGEEEDGDEYNGALDYYVLGSMGAGNGNGNKKPAAPDVSAAYKLQLHMTGGNKSSDSLSSDDDDDDDFDDSVFVDALTGIPGEC